MLVQALIAAEADVNKSTWGGRLLCPLLLANNHTQAGKVADLLSDAGAHELSGEEPSDEESSCEGSSEDEV